MTGMRALLVGIDAYGDRPLAGCVNDIDAIQKLLLEQLCVEPAQIRRLAAPRADGHPRPSEIATGEPTRDGILDALVTLTASVGPDDRVFIYFAGHGTQLEFTTRDGQRFTREAILPVDFDVAGRACPRYLFDWELSALLRNLAARTPAVSLVLDCCSAAGVTRDPGPGTARFHPATRALEATDAIPPPERAARGLGSALVAPTDTSMVVAACLDDETARETEGADGIRHGVLTRALLGALDGLDAALCDVRWSRIWSDIEAAVARSSRAQHPWASSSLRRRVFGGPPEPGDAGYALSRSPGSPVVRIHAGTRAGVTRGARIAVYGAEPALLPPLGSAGELEARCTVLEVTDAHDGHAEARIAPDAQDRWPQDCRGRLAKAGEHARLAVAVPRDAGPLAKLVAASALLTVTDDPASCDVALERRADGRWALTDDVHGMGDQPGVPALPPCDADDFATAVQLAEHHARHTAPLQIARRCTDRPGALRVSLLDCNRLSYSLPAEECQDPPLPLVPAGRRAPYELRAGGAGDDDGDRFCIRIENGYTGSLFVTVLNCDSDGAVTLVADRLQIRGGARATLWHPSGLGQPFRAALSDGQPIGIDRFVFLATTDRAARFDHLELHATFAAQLPTRRITLAPRRGSSEALYTASVATLRLARQDARPDGHGAPRTRSELGRGLAIVIGIDEYGGGIQLENAVCDARAIGERLRVEHGFAVCELYNQDATRDALRTLFRTQLRERVKEYERVVIYFAGHGLTKFEDDQLIGNLLPCGGNPDDPDSLVTMAEVRQACEAAAAQPVAGTRKRHVLLLLDCCMAGALGTRLAATRGQVLYHERYERLLGLRGVQFIGAAAHHQEANESLRADHGAGHSPFASALLTALTLAGGDGRGHPVDRNHDGIFFASELYQYVRDELYRWYAGHKHAQTPVYLTLGGDEGGDLPFAASRRATELPRAEKLSARSNPYHGARAYGDTDRDELLLFGRDAAIDSLERHLDANPATVVTGPSRSGKSSIVHAGLVRRRRARGWDIHHLKPGEQLPGVTGGTAPRLIIVDHVETLSPAQAGVFLGELVRWTELAPCDRVVVILRSGEHALLGDGSRWQAWRVPDMARDELRAAIEGPADVSVLFFTDQRSPEAPPRSLIDTLLDDVEGMPDALSLLSNTLHAMVGKQIARGDRFLTWSDYRDVGGIARTLVKDAEAMYLAEPDANRRMIRKLLARLVDVDAPKRRAMQRAELGSSDGNGNDERKLAVLECMERARIVVRGETIELAHDALVTGWSGIAKPVTRWSVITDLIENRRSVVRLQAALADASARWRDPSSNQSRWGSAQLDAARAGFVGLPSLFARVADLVMPRGAVRRIQQSDHVALSGDETRFLLDSLRARRNAVITGTAVTLILVLGSLAGLAITRTARVEARAKATLEELNAVRAAASIARQSPREIGRAATRALGAVHPDIEHAPALPQALLELAQQRGSLPLEPSRDLGGTIVSASLEEDRLVAAVWRDDTRDLVVVRGSLTSLLPAKTMVPRSEVRPVVAVSPHGTWIAYAANGSLRLWKVSEECWNGDPIPLQQARRSSESPTAYVVTFSGDEARVAVASGSPGSIDVWNVENRTPAMPTLALDGNGTLALDHTGSHVLASPANHDWKVTVVNVVDDAHPPEVQVDGFDTQRATTARFSPDGRWLAIGSPGGIGIWSLTAGRPFPWRQLRSLRGNITALAFSQTGDRLAAGTLEGDTLVWMSPDDLFGDGSIRHLVNHDERNSADNPVQVLAFAGDTVAAASVNGTRMQRWNVGPPLSLDLRHGDAVTSLAISRDGRWLATGSVDHSARVWSTVTGELHARLSRAQPVNAVVWHDGLLAIAGDDRTLEITSKDGKEPRPLKNHKSPIRAVSISPSGLVATASGDGTVHVVDAGGDEKLKVEHAPEKQGDEFSPDDPQIAVSAVAWSHDGRWLASAGNNHLVKLWAVDPSSPHPAVRKIDQADRVLDHGARLLALAWSADDEHVLSAGSDGAARLWRARDRALIATLRHRAAVVAASFSSAGDQIVTASEDATARLWTRTGELVRALEGHRGAVRDAAFAPARCKKLATVGDDGTLRLWSTTSGRQLATFTAHGGEASHVLFLDDGSRVATAGADGYVRVFPACPKRILDTLCDMARNQNHLDAPRCPSLKDGDAGDAEDPCCP